MIVFIDESGTLPDVADRYIVLVALASHRPEELTKIIPKFRRKIPPKGKRKLEVLKELKFHYVGNITRKRVLEELSSKNIQIYILIVDKMGRKILDNPQNYGKLAKNLINLLDNNVSTKNVLIDKHFSDKKSSAKFQLLLEKNRPQDFKLEFVDSIVDSRIDLADFVAGAVFRKYRVGDPTFYRIIASKISKEEIKKWNEL